MNIWYLYIEKIFEKWNYIFDDKEIWISNTTVTGGCRRSLIPFVLEELAHKAFPYNINSRFITISKNELKYTNINI